MSHWMLACRIRNILICVSIKMCVFQKCSWMLWSSWFKKFIIMKKWESAKMLRLIFAPYIREKSFEQLVFDSLQSETTQNIVLLHSLSKHHTIYGPLLLNVHFPKTKIHQNEPKHQNFGYFLCFDQIQPWTI